MDELDIKILNLLQRNGRASITDIANTLKKPRSTIRERILRLERSGYIRGYRAVVDPEKLGYRYLALVMLKVRRRITTSGMSNQEEIARKILHDSVKDPSLPFVEEAYIVTGAYDIVLKVWAKRWGDLTSFLIRYLATFEDIISSETFLVLKSVSSNNGIFPCK
ncbi:MAG: Lrp/AsnC family transcriptional regulator [Thermoprotei archaeon]|nr:MAG: Lrp/AsnC family transcriptional regulator [Thermoprotei archaeon]RLF19233.1 MAG: Lrp/AsnC family transcriptional regulator [Thermoprotei archaeon]